MEPEKENFFSEIFKFALIALLVVVPFRLFIAQPFIVSGASMSPTFETGEYLIIDQITYRFEPPKRGDVVVFKYPKDPSKYFIKRLIGLPGETVEIQGSKVLIHNPDGVAVLTLPEGYVEKGNAVTDMYLTRELGEDEYFVMGDNRKASSDSRVWGPLPEENLVGRAFLRLLPAGKIGVFPGHIEELPTN